MAKKNHPAQVADSETCVNDSTTANLIKPPSKNESFGVKIITTPGGVTALDTNARSFSDFDQIGADGKFYTTCLHTDVSKFRNKYGVDIVGENEKYTSRHGYSAHFTRYRIADQKAAAKVISLINRWRTERGAEPINNIETKQLINQFPDTFTAE